MGGFNIYDILIDNPGEIIIIDDDGKSTITNVKKKYNWHTKIRVVTQEGKVTSLGKYDGYGYVDVGKILYEIVMCNYKYHNKKRTTLECNKEQLNSTEQNMGLMIHDIVYKYLKKHKSYKQLVANYNLYEELLKFTKKRITDDSVKMLVGEQDIYIYGKNTQFEKKTKTQVLEDLKFFPGNSNKKKKFIEDNYTKVKDGYIYTPSYYIIEGKNDTYFIDPEKNVENKKRIRDLVNKFVDSVITS